MDNPTIEIFDEIALQLESPKAKDYLVKIYGIIRRPALAKILKTDAEAISNVRELQKTNYNVNF